MIRPASSRIVLSIATAASLLVCSSTPTQAAPPSNKYMQEGIALFNQGKYMESLSSFNQAKATDSDNALLHYYMASALLKLNHKEDAIREYKLTLVLEPQGRLTSLCETALRALGASQAAIPTGSPPAVPPSASTGKGDAKLSTARGGKTTALTTSTKKPQPSKSAALVSARCVSVLCGCPICQKLSLTLTDLNSKYGDRIEFVRTTKNATDDKSKELIKNYSVSECPTVLLFTERSEHATEYRGNIVLADLIRDVDLLAKTATKTRYTPIEDKGLASVRKMVVDEVEARISHDVDRVDFQVKKIQQDCDADLANVNRRDPDAESQRDLIKSESERKIKAVRDDFERRKREWYAAAEERIKGISSTGPTK